MAKVEDCVRELVGVAIRAFITAINTRNRDSFKADDPASLDQNAGHRLQPCAASGAEITRSDVEALASIGSGCMQFYAQPATASRTYRFDGEHDGNILERLTEVDTRACACLSFD